MTLEVRIAIQCILYIDPQRQGDVYLLFSLECHKLLFFIHNGTYKIIDTCKAWVTLETNASWKIYLGEYVNSAIPCHRYCGEDKLHSPQQCFSMGAFDFRLTRIHSYIWLSRLNCWLFNLVLKRWYRFSFNKWQSFSHWYRSSFILNLLSKQISGACYQLVAMEYWEYF